MAVLSELKLPVRAHTFSFSSVDHSRATAATHHVAQEHADKARRLALDRRNTGLDKREKAFGEWEYELEARHRYLLMAHVHKFDH